MNRSKITANGIFLIKRLVDVSLFPYAIHSWVFPKSYHQHELESRRDDGVYLFKINVLIGLDDSCECVTYFEHKEAFQKQVFLTKP